MMMYDQHVIGGERGGVGGLGDGGCCLDTNIVSCMAVGLR